MHSCSTCPKGEECRGNLLNPIIVHIYDAIRSKKTQESDLDAIARSLTRNDMHTLAETGIAAESFCWNKGFVLSISQILAHMIMDVGEEDALLARMERMVDRVHRIFSRLPNGIAIDLQSLNMEIFFQTTDLLNRAGSRKSFPANMFALACNRVLGEQKARVIAEVKRKG